MSSCLKVKQRHGLMQQLIPARQTACQLHLRLNRQRPDFFQAGSKKESSVQKGRKHKFSRHSKPESKKTDRNEDASSSAPSFPSLPPPAKKKGRKTRSELIVIEEGDDIPAENEPMFGRVVWAQFSGQRTYHPAIVIKGSLVNLATPDIDHAFVFWFSDHKVSVVPREKLLDFVGCFKKRAALCKSKQDKQGLQEAVEETHRQSEYGSYAVPRMDLIQWAWSGFPGLVNASSEALQPGQEVFCFPESISERLSAIGNEIRQKAAEKDRDIPNVFHSENALAAVREGKTEISDVCIGCADMDRKVQCRHPLFEGGLCHMCQKDVKETVYAVGSDGSHSYCAVCAAGGELFVCDTPSCGRVYCFGCVEELAGEDILKKVQESRKWSCFLCQPFKPDTHGLLKPHPDWQERLVLFFDNGNRITVVPDMDYFRQRRPIRVLSLFDGIGTGLVALKQAGLEVAAYYASEVDEQAILVSQANHGGEIIQLGSITHITSETLKRLVPIDLLIGGSPCNELSLVNPNRKGFDVEGSGVLFFDFYRVLHELLTLNGNTHLFWMFENVSSMPIAFREVISRFLECQPAVWDAKHLSAQKRSRFFWGNIPGIYSTPEVSEALRQKTDLDMVLTPQCDRQANVSCVRTVTTQPNSLLQVGAEQKGLPITMAGKCDMLWMQELERLFGFPAHYTDVGNLTVSKRRGLLGRSWSVQVVTEILRPLGQYFATTSQQNETEVSEERPTTSTSTCKDTMDERDPKPTDSNQSSAGTKRVQTGTTLEFPVVTTAGSSGIAGQESGGNQMDITEASCTGISRDERGVTSSKVSNQACSSASVETAASHTEENDKGERVCWSSLISNANVRDGTLTIAGEQGKNHDEEEAGTSSSTSPGEFASKFTGARTSETERQPASMRNSSNNSVDLADTSNMVYTLKATNSNNTREGRQLTVTMKRMDWQHSLPLSSEVSNPSAEEKRERTALTDTVAGRLRKRKACKEGYGNQVSKKRSQTDGGDSAFMYSTATDASHDQAFGDGQQSRQRHGGNVYTAEGISRSSKRQ